MWPRTNKSRSIALLAAVVLLGLWFSRGPLLRGWAGLLIIDQPTATVDVVCLSSPGNVPETYGSFRLIRDLWRQGQRPRVLLIGPQPGRVSEVGAEPSFAALSRSALAAYRVPPEDLSILYSPGRSDHDFARTLGAWLAAHPGATVLWACPAFRSANLRRNLDAVLGPAAAARVRVRALADDRANAANWWRSRAGLRHFGTAWLMRIGGWLGHNARPPASRSADEYEREFLASLGERSP